MASTYQLVIRSGPNAGTAYPLDRPELFIGRDLNNDIVINDPEVSRRHSRLFMQGATYAIEDLGSTNGTTVGSQRLAGPYILNSGDFVTFGEHVSLVFERTAVGHSDVTIASGQAVSEATIASVGPVMSPQAPVPSPYLAAVPDQPAQDIYRPVPGAAMPSVYAGQVPSHPQMSAPGGQAKKKFPVGLVVVIVILLILCVCVVALVAIDQLKMWCDILGPVFNIFSPGACPK